MSVSPLVGAAIGAALVGAWGAWKYHRNSLPDDERAQLFWNDQRYEKLQQGITKGLWIWFAVMAVAVVLAFGALWLG